MNQANKKVCLKLNHALYRLVQAARLWWLKFVNLFVNFDFKCREVDPCLVYWKNEYGILILILCLHDCLLTRDKLAIESGIDNIKKMFKVTITKNVKEYLGCRINTSRKGEIMVRQPHIYKHLEDKFQDVLDMKWSEKKKIATPSTPAFKQVRVKEGERVLSPEEQTLYRSGVGILLYLVKHMRPDLSNATQELPKAMDVTNYLHWRELLQVITYALKTQEKDIVLKPDSKLVKLN